jgi:phage-related protein (TIGR01555 family)
VKRAPAKKKAMTISDSALMRAGQRPIEPQRRRLELPRLPPGVLPKGAKMAMDDGANSAFGWSNAMAGGIGCGLYFPGYPYLAELAQRAEYRSPVETIAEEMTRNWLKFTGTSGDKQLAEKIKLLEQDMTDFGIQDKFRRATELDGYFGMAKLFVRLKNDEAARDTPLILDSKTIPRGSLMGFKVIEAMWVTPNVWNAVDPTADDFYRPTMWYVLGKPTHSSRLINFVSREVPDLLKPSYNFGGISLSQMMEGYVNQWLRTKNSVADLIHNFSIIALSTDMQALLAADEGGKDLFARVEMFIKNRDNKGLMTLNKDSEELTQIAVPLGTLDALQAQAQEHMSAVSRLPLVKAFGITPSGLNASSEEEIIVFYDHIHARQEIQYGANARTVLQILQLNRFGEIDPAIGIEFTPLRELDGEALGRVRKGDAELAATLIQNGVIAPEEERQRLADDPNSGYNNLVVEDVPDPPEDPTDQETQGGDGDED